MKIKWLITPLLVPTTIVGLLTSCTKTNNPIVPEQKTYIVHTVATQGDLDWNVTPQAPVNIFKWTDAGPVYDTFAQMVYIKDQGFAIRMLSYEPRPVVDPSPEGRDVYKDSCLEAFFNFGSDMQYLNAEVNSNRRTCQEFGLPWSSGQTRTPIEDTEWCFTIWNTQKTDKYWSVIITITLEQICHWYGSALSPSDFVSGFTFTGNFFKICGTPGEYEHYGMWNDMDNKDHTFHDPTQFGKFIIE